MVSLNLKSVFLLRRFLARVWNRPNPLFWLRRSEKYRRHQRLMFSFERRVLAECLWQELRSVLWAGKLKLLRCVSYRICKSSFTSISKSCTILPSSVQLPGQYRSEILWRINLSRLLYLRRHFWCFWVLDCPEKRNFFTRYSIFSLLGLLIV